MGRERGQDILLCTALGLCILKDSPPLSNSLSSHVPDSSYLSVSAIISHTQQIGGTVSTGNGTKWPAHLWTEPISSTLLNNLDLLNSDSGSHGEAVFDIFPYASDPGMIEWNWKTPIWSLPESPLLLMMVIFFFHVQDLEIHYINIEYHEWKQQS